MTEEQTNQPEAAPSALPEGFQTEGQKIVADISKAIEGMDLLAVATALTATLFAAVTSEQLGKEAREALSIMVYDLGQSVLRANEITEERLGELMAERSGVMIDTGKPEESEG